MPALPGFMGIMQCQWNWKLPMKLRPSFVFDLNLELSLPRGRESKSKTPRFEGTIQDAKAVAVSHAIALHS
jgi:hypothetical protein